MRKTIYSVAVWENYIFILKTYFTVNFDFTSKIFVWLDVFFEVNHLLHLTFLSVLFSPLFVVFLQTFWKTFRKLLFYVWLPFFKDVLYGRFWQFLLHWKSFFEEKLLRRKNFAKTFSKNGKNKMYTTQITQALLAILISF